MNSDLLKNNFLIVKNFISPERAIDLYKEFRLCDEFYNFNGDPQAPNSASVYNYLPSLELLCEKTKQVSELIGETVFPTYTYSRIYKENSVLKKHTDRGACEISLTVHLHGDKPWPIWVETPEGKPRCVVLNSGDALIYLGCVAPHWRDEYVGKEYAQFFLHYVRSRGAFSKLYFDKAKENGDINKLFEEYKSMGWLTEESLFRGSVQVEERSENSKYKFSQKNKKDIVLNKDPNFIILGDKDSPITTQEKYLTRTNTNEKQKTTSTRNVADYIKVFEDVFPAEFCDYVLEEYANTDLWTKTLTGSGHDPNARNCNVIPLSEKFVIEQNVEVRKEIDESLFQGVSHSLKLYEDCLPGADLEIKEDSGYELLRYNVGEFYVEHTDSFKEMPRAISCIIALNDDYDGGEISFFSRELSYKLKRGSIIMFPSNFMYPHEIQKVTSGTRYSIITWLV
jgi:hypothetical protein